MTDSNCIFAKLQEGKYHRPRYMRIQNFVILDGSGIQGTRSDTAKANILKISVNWMNRSQQRCFPLAGKIGAAMKQALGCSGFNVVQNNGGDSRTDSFSFSCTYHSKIRGRTSHGYVGAGRLIRLNSQKSAAA